MNEGGWPPTTGAIPSSFHQLFQFSKRIEKLNEIEEMELAKGQRSTPSKLKVFDWLGAAAAAPREMFSFQRNFISLHFFSIQYIPLGPPCPSTTEFHHFPH